MWANKVSNSLVDEPRNQSNRAAVRRPEGELCEQEKPALAKSGAGSGLNGCSLPRLGGSRQVVPVPRANWVNSSTRNAASKSAAQDSKHAPGGLTLPATSTSSPRAFRRIALTVTDRKAEIAAVTDVQRTLGVSIEASRTSSGLTTFIIKGSEKQVEQARFELDWRLSPATFEELEIPTTACPAVIGSHGSSLQRIIESTHTKITIGSASNTDDVWHTSTTKVLLEGSEPCIAKAKAQIRDIVEQRLANMRITRSLPDHAHLLLRTWLKDPEKMPPGVKLAITEHSVSLSGPYNPVSEAKAIVDTLVTNIDESVGERQLPLDFRVALPDGILPEDVFLDGNALFGTRNKLDDAERAVSQYVSQLRVLSLNLALSHNHNVTHARKILTFLHHTTYVAEIAAEYHADISMPPESASIPLSLKIFSAEPKNAQIAKLALHDLILALSPDYFFEVDGISKPKAIALAKHKAKDLPVGLNCIFYESNILLAYYNPQDEFPLRLDLVREYFDAAANIFNDVKKLQKTFTQRSIAVPSVDQKHLRQPFGSAKDELDKLCIHDGINVVDIEYKRDEAVISGPSSLIDALVEAIPKIIDTSKVLHEKSNFQVSLRFDPNHMNQLIGRSGSNIEKLRVQHGVHIDVDDTGKVYIRGLEENVLAVKKTIEDLQQRLQDEVIVTLHISPKYHPLLIGAKGKFVRRLTDKYNVLIKFPGPNASGKEAEEVLLRGPNKGVAKARKELEDLIIYEKTHSFVQTIDVPSKVMPRIIGKQGGTINAIKDATGTQITVENEQNADGTISVVVKGEKLAIEKAVDRLKVAMENILTYEEREIEIEQEYHRYLIGPENQIKRAIVDRAFGGDGNDQHALKIPPSSVMSSVIRLAGPRSAVDAMEREIRSIVDAQKQKEQFQTKLHIPIEHHGQLIGLNGATFRRIRARFDAILEVPRKSENSDVVVVKAPSAEALQKATEYIQSLVDAYEVTIEIPQATFVVWPSRVAMIKQIETDFNVRFQIAADVSFKNDFDTGKQKPAMEDREFIFVTEEYKPKGSGTVSCRITSKSSDECERAKNKLQAIIEHVASFSTLGYLWLTKSKQFSQIIGHVGSNIKRIREETGAIISIRKNSSPEYPVVVLGGTEQVEKARSLLIVAIQSK